MDSWALLLFSKGVFPASFKGFFSIVEQPEKNITEANNKQIKQSFFIFSPSFLVFKKNFVNPVSEAYRKKNSEMKNYLPTIEKIELLIVELLVY
jgi:hypothetical protein